MVNKYLCDGVPRVMSELLARINAHYSLKANATGPSACYLFNASNFGNEKFITLIDRLYNLIRLDLSMYRVWQRNAAAQRYVTFVKLPQKTEPIYYS